MIPPADPKPKDRKRPKPEALHVYRDGREVCNLLTKEGHDIYESKKREMHERQNHICCLHGHIPTCPGKLRWAEATFDHEIPRGYDGAKRDDRIVIEVKQKDGTVKIKWLNGVAHPQCNVAKGSRRINYNAAHNGDVDWELIPKTTHSGKVLYRCPSCGHETPAPTKHHECWKGEA